MTEIANHVLSNEKSIIFIDELDKIWHDTSWKSYIKAEIFDLLDGRWPTGLKIENEEHDDDDGAPDEANGVIAVKGAKEEDEGTIKLRLQTFIVAAGTFQDFFEIKSTGKIGFGDRQAALKEEIDAGEIAKQLPRELTNRFNSGLIVLPALHPEHYRILSEAVAKVLPEWILEEFRKAAGRQIEKAIATQKGCRFVEECILEALKFARKPTPIVISKADEGDGISI